MSGNGRGATRQPGRSPPFLVIGLLVALIILGFNYWNLSSSNASLSSTNMDLQDQIRILTSKKLSEEQGKRDVERKYQLLEQRLGSKDSEIKHLQEESDKKQSSVDTAENARKECEVNLQTCETNNSGIQQQLEEVNKQLEELKKDKAQTPPSCDSQCKEATRKLYSDILQKAGAPVVQQLINAGFDVGDDLKVQVQQAAIGDKNQIKPPEQKKPEVKEMEQKPTDVTTKPVENKADNEGKITNSKGLLNTIVEFKDKLQKRVKQSGDKMGIDSLRPGSLHDIINRTQEGFKEGLAKTKEVVSSLQGEGKLHASDNITNVTGQINDTKNDTLVGNDNNNQLKEEVKKDGNDTENSLKKPDGESGKLNEQAPKPLINTYMGDGDKKVAKYDTKPLDSLVGGKKAIDNSKDPLYDGDEDKVEERESNRGAEETKKEDDSIDVLGKNLNKVVVQ